jgi:uncharacterized RDD family membrane protein YckC
VTHDAPAPGRLSVGQESAASPLGSARFVTGEAISLEMRVARLGSRMLARMIDIIIQVVLAYALILLVSLLFGIFAIAGGAQLLDGNLFGAVVLIVVVIALVGYPVALETMTRGRTVGKMLLGLRVVRDDGGPVRFRQALTRGLVGTAIEWPGVIAAPLTWLACLWTMAVNPDGKRLGDYAAGTVVIHERTPAAWGWVPRMPNGLAGWASTLDLAGLDDDLALAVRHFLSRNRDLREPARTQLGQRLAAEVAAVTNPPPPPQTPGWAYLAAVHAERHQRAMRRLVAVRSRAATVWPELVTAPPQLPAGLPRLPVPQPQVTH